MTLVEGLFSKVDMFVVTSVADQSATSWALFVAFEPNKAARLSRE